MIAKILQNQIIIKNVEKTDIGFISKKYSQKVMEIYEFDLDEDNTDISITPKEDIYEIIEIENNGHLWEHLNNEDVTTNFYICKKVEIYTDSMVLVETFTPAELDIEGLIEHIKETIE